MLTIIDGNNLLFRAYYGVKSHLSRKDGTPTGAIYGFCNMILSLLSKAEEGDSFVVAFDAGRKNFRHEIYPEYKANRSATPEDLVLQIPISRAAVLAMGLECIEIPGFEADDIIATIARRECNINAPVRIATGDKDLMQLISNCCTLYDGMKEREITAADAVEKFGVSPDKILEVQAILGDSIDNIPGVAGIGPKGAAKLIAEFGSLDGIYANIDRVQPDRIRDLLIQHKESAYMSRKLAALSDSAPVPADAGAKPWALDVAAAQEFFINELESPSLAAKVGKIFNNESAVPIDLLTTTPVGEADHPFASEGDLVVSEKELEKFIASIKEVLVVEVVGKGHHYMVDKMVAINLASRERAIKINVANAPASLFDENVGLTASVILEKLGAALRDEKILKVARNFKHQLHILTNENFDALSVAPIADIELMAYALGMQAAKQFPKVEAGGAIAQYEEIAAALNSAPILKNIYEKCDAPLLPVLYKIERAGIVLDRAALAELAGELHEKMDSVAAKIVELSGGKNINIASPQQLGILLFDDLKIRNPKKYSTDAGVLGGLVEEHPIVPLVLEWRRLAKLTGTYTDALPNAVQADGRIHSTFLQTSTNPGRLSSRDPNMQNIPVKGDAGARMRAAFVAAVGHKFIIADYSQIQLRILADIADVKELKQIFMSGRDIHSMTAHKIFGVPVESVSSDQRRSAKIVNFSIAYGVSAFGLAQQLGIPKGAASDLINSYFDAFPEIKAYNDRMAEIVRRDAAAFSPMGRRIDIPEARIPAMRQHAVRIAITAPIQGAEADMMRLAAVEVDRVLAGSGAKLVLQVHDELVVEAPDAIAADVAARVKSAMENIQKLSVPLVAEAEVSERLE
ncbi:MAG: hypothetical protein LBB23_01380 [Rickettsiales bacterium]|jgi:DNA polymerase-1|nr:hypothetical protein [Rickettsiales bacterium]